MQHLERSEDHYRKARAKIRPWVSYMFYLRSEAVPMMKTVSNSSKRRSYDPTDCPSQGPMPLRIAYRRLLCPIRIAYRRILGSIGAPTDGAMRLTSGTIGGTGDVGRVCPYGLPTVGSAPTAFLP